MSHTNRRTWVSILIAAIIVVGILALTVIGGGVYFFYRHVDSRFVDRPDAEAEFEQARARFAGQPPLLDLRKGDEGPVLHRELENTSSSGPGLQRLRVLAYDQGAHKLVRVSIPFWLLRLAPSRHVTIFGGSGVDFDSDRLHLTLDDLERRGPGLVLDETDRRGARVLVWTE